MMSASAVSSRKVSASLLNLGMDLIFFDATSTYFEIEDEDKLRRYGTDNSKDKWPDRPPIVVGLAVTRSGFPVRCCVLPGNASGAALIKPVQEELAGWRLNRLVWLVASDMASADEGLVLQRGGGHAIMGEKLHSKHARAA